MKKLFLFFVTLIGFAGCNASQPPVKPTAPKSSAPPAAAAQTTTPKPSAVTSPVATAANVAPRVFPVMLGIDTLEAEGFAAVKGKRIGLLTNPAGVNRRGVATIEVLRRAAGVRLVALYAVEHGVYGDQPAEKTFTDMTDARTGLPVFSLYNQTPRFRPTPQQLKGIDALVIDLQDIGTRSYTFTGAMKTAMQACFENGKEVIVLDRPNPLGGLKADGPSLDADLLTDVGRFRVPYVHGLTMGELARMTAALQPPTGLALSDQLRAKSKLTVIPMRGWRREMRWPETGLTFVPTSPAIQDFAAVMGYPMVGLGSNNNSGFSHGIGKQYPFRGIYFKGKTAEQLEKDLNALRLPGIKFRKVAGVDDKGQSVTGVYVEVSDWDDWNPTELNFHLMRLACRYSPANPFAKLTAAQEKTFNIHVGSRAWLEALKRDGARVDVEGFLKDWREKAKVYQQQSKKYWLYN